MTSLKKASLFDPPAKVDGTIYLMRHGKTPMDTAERSDGWLDLPLTDKGRLEIIPPQQYLKTCPIACIYAPSLKRTTETAHIVRSGLLSKPPIEKAEEARTWHLGAMAGTPKRLGKPKVKKLIASPDTKPLGGESYNQFKDRFLPWFEEQCQEVEEGGEPILVILSGSNLRLLGDYLFGDDQAINLGEGGLVALHCCDGDWHREVIYGADDESLFLS